MSAERYEIKECELDVLAIAGTDGTRYIDGEEIEARVIRQLRSDLAAVTAERDEFRTEVARLQNRLIDALLSEKERDQLRSQLAEYENAPTVAWQDVHEPQDLYHRRPVQVDVRELIARKVKK